MLAHGTTTAYRSGCRCATCREAQRVYNTSYYRAKHPEKRKERPAHGVTAYRNGCRCDVCCEAQSVYNGRYHANHLESRRSYSLARRNANVEDYRAAFRAWYHTNPARNRALSLAYHQRSKNAPGTATAEQIKARIDFYGGCCAYCGAAPWQELDHAIPLSRGGTNWPANIRPACEFCNTSKGAKTVTEFIAYRAARDQGAVKGGGGTANVTLLAN
jgi:5-methylcytosine-specific restriction endonuclease McrA